MPAFSCSSKRPESSEAAAAGEKKSNFRAQHYKKRGRSKFRSQLNCPAPVFVAVTMASSSSSSSSSAFFPKFRVLPILLLLFFFVFCHVTPLVLSGVPITGDNGDDSFCWNCDGSPASTDPHHNELPPPTPIAAAAQDDHEQQQKLQDLTSYPANFQPPPGP